jgi:hypothetical protein
MKSSAAVIAESLSEFGRCLRETELPNDVETTQRILDAQTAERDAIKAGFCGFFDTRKFVLFWHPNIFK